MNLHDKKLAIINLLVIFAIGIPLTLFIFNKQQELRGRAATNAILDCYSDLTLAANCNNIANKNSTDLNDDGAVNQVDYNLFLREIATQPG